MIKVKKVVVVVCDICKIEFEAKVYYYEKNYAMKARKEAELKEWNFEKSEKIFNKENEIFKKELIQANVDLCPKCEKISRVKKL